jgi:hypothetical protein
VPGTAHSEREAGQHNHGIASDWEQCRGDVAKQRLLMQSAAEACNLEHVRWLCMKVPLDEWVAGTISTLQKTAGATGDVQMLQFLQDSGCLSHKRELMYCVLAHAARANRLEAFEWAHGACPQLFQIAIGRGSTVPALVLSHGSLAMCEWLHAHGLYVRPDRHMRHAGADVAVLQWLVDVVGCRWSKHTWKHNSKKAAGLGHHAALRWYLVDGPAPLLGMGGAGHLRECARSAIAGGHLPVLEWLHSKGCTLMSPDFCIRAARVGRHDVLAWLADNDCAYDDAKVLLAAARHGQQSVLEWLISRGCRCNVAVLIAAAKRGRHTQLVCHLQMVAGQR